MVNSFHFKVRRLHRYLGVFLGIQFLFWTIGGLYCNGLLRIFSIAGLLTILSGFILFWVSQKRSRLE